MTDFVANKTPPRLSKRSAPTLPTSGLKSAPLVNLPLNALG